jgi:hypothetical protein
MRIYRLISLVLLLLLVPIVSTAAPKAKLWSYWNQSGDDNRSTIIEHSRWDEFLRRNLDSNHSSGINRMGYGDVMDSDRRMLQDYVGDMEKVTVTELNPAEQMAYWINLYNAVTVLLVIDHYPVESITDINKPWDRKLLRIEDQEVSLNDIEHRILRPIYRDNRIHYAVNCASIGCPNLQPEAFTARNLDELLERGAREYASHPRGVSIEDNEMTLSSIYKWFKEDFGGNKREVLAHIARYAPSEMAKKIEGYEGRIRYGYDWSINE